MASQGPYFRGTQAEYSIGGVAWDAYTDLGAEDGTTDSVSLVAEEFSQMQHCTNFGFTIPTHSVIDGVQVRVKSSSVLAELVFSQLNLVTTGVTYVGTDYGGQEGTFLVLTWQNFGDTTYDKWGYGLLQPEIINDSAFGVIFGYDNLTIFSRSAFADAVTITVGYTEGQRLFQLPSSSTDDDRRGELVNTTSYPPTGGTFTDYPYDNFLEMLKIDDAAGPQSKLSNIFCRFDTSSIPDNAVISDAWLEFVPDQIDDPNGDSLLVDYYDWGGGAIVVGDLVTTTTSIIETTTLASLTADTLATRNITNLSGINKSGMTSLRMLTTGTPSNPDIIRLSIAASTSVSLRSLYRQAPALRIAYSVPEVWNTQQGTVYYSRRRATR